MPLTDTETFFAALVSAIEQNQFVKLTLSDRRYKTNELKNVFVKPVQLKSGLHLSFVYRYPTKDITKNYVAAEGTQALQHMLAHDFLKADLFTTIKDFHLTLTKSGKAILTQKDATVTEPPSAEHNKEKKRYVKPENNIYLRELGITSAEGKVKSDKQDKFRQINKYVEIVEGIVQQAGLPVDFQLADMGAGKGYLTFALYDYLTNNLHLSPQITGIEMRQNLVDTCNTIAAKAQYENLHFITGSIVTASLPAVDMLIALHACDTATDEAIYRGIKADAQVIICAPCCHKQIRKQMKPGSPLSTITQFGILEERQAEMLTDTIRALILEAHGYKAKVFEFISTEHTPKNVLIVGLKAESLSAPRKETLDEIKRLKALFGIEQHHLEKLLDV